MTSREPLTGTGDPAVTHAAAGPTFSARAARLTTILESAEAASAAPEKIEQLASAFKALNHLFEPQAKPQDYATDRSFTTAWIASTLNDPPSIARGFAALLAMHYLPELGKELRASDLDPLFADVPFQVVNLSLLNIALESLRPGTTDAALDQLNASCATFRSKLIAFVGRSKEGDTILHNFYTTDPTNPRLPATSENEVPIPGSASATTETLASTSEATTDFEVDSSPALSAAELRTLAEALLTIDNDIFPRRERNSELFFLNTECALAPALIAHGKEILMDRLKSEGALNNYEWSIAYGLFCSPRGDPVAEEYVPLLDSVVEKEACAIFDADAPNAAVSSALLGSIGILSRAVPRPATLQDQVERLGDLAGNRSVRAYSDCGDAIIALLKTVPPRPSWGEQHARAPLAELTLIEANPNRDDVLFLEHVDLLHGTLDAIEDGGASARAVLNQAILSAKAKAQEPVPQFVKECWRRVEQL